MQFQTLFITQPWNFRTIAASATSVVRNPRLNNVDRQKKTPVASPEQAGYEGLGLTEDEIKMLEERGIINVDSAEVAFKIAASRQPYDRLTLGWEKDGIDYSISGTINGNA